MEKQADIYARYSPSRDRDQTLEAANLDEPTNVDL